MSGCNQQSSWTVLVNNFCHATLLFLSGDCFMSFGPCEDFFRLPLTGNCSVGRQPSRLPIVFPTRKLLLGECSLKVNDRVTINRPVKLQCDCTMPTKLYVCRLCCSGDPTKNVFIRSSIEVWLTFRENFGDGVKFICTCSKFILHIDVSTFF